MPLSGGADSSATATIVGAMCRAVHHEFQKGNQQVRSKREDVKIEVLTKEEEGYERDEWEKQKGK